MAIGQYNGIMVMILLIGHRVFWGGGGINARTKFFLTLINITVPFEFEEGGFWNFWNLTKTNCRLDILEAACGSAAPLIMLHSCPVQGCGAVRCGD